MEPRIIDLSLLAQPTDTPSLFETARRASTAIAPVVQAMRELSLTLRATFGPNVVTSELGSSALVLEHWLKQLELAVQAEQAVVLGNM